MRVVRVYDIVRHTIASQPDYIGWLVPLPSLLHRLPIDRSLVVKSLEHDFGVEIPPDLDEEIVTVGDLVRTLEQLLAERLAA